MSCWRYTPSPKQDRFQDFLEAICPDFQHTTYPNKITNIVIPTYLNCRAQKLCCVRTIQQPLPVWIIVTSLPTHISINSHPFPVGIVLQWYFIPASTRVVFMSCAVRLNH